MTLAEYAEVFARRWRVIAVVMAIGAVVAFAVTQAIPPTYVATTTSFIWVSDSAAGASNANSQNALGQVGSYPALATSSYVLDPVIAKLGLKEDSNALRDQIEATNPTDTVNLVIEASSRSATQARDIANEVAEQSGTLIESLVSPAANGGASPVKVSIAVPAVTPAGPSSPRPLLNIGLGLLVGLALGLVLAVRQDRRQTASEASSEMYPRGRFAKRAPEAPTARALALWRRRSKNLGATE